MTWLLEDPTPTLVAAVLIEAILTLALVKTGNGKLLFAIAGVAALAACLLLLEWIVVTDKEEIEVSLSGAAKALEANDSQAVLSFVDPASPIYQQVRSELSRVNITSARYTQLDVTINRKGSSMTAKADFMAHINAKDKRGEFPYENVVRRFTVDLKRQGDRWLVTGYQIQGQNER